MACVVLGAEMEGFPMTWARVGNFCSTFQATEHLVRRDIDIMRKLSAAASVRLQCQPAAEQMGPKGSNLLAATHEKWSNVVRDLIANLQSTCPQVSAPIERFALRIFLTIMDTGLVEGSKPSTIAAVAIALANDFLKLHILKENIAAAAGRSWASVQRILRRVASDSRVQAAVKLGPS